MPKGDQAKTRMNYGKWANILANIIGATMILTANPSPLHGTQNNIEIKSTPVFGPKVPIKNTNDNA